MKLSQWIREEAIQIGFPAKDKWECLDRLIQNLVDISLIPKENHDLVKDAIIAREKSMSTGMESGIAIPHAAVDGVPDLAVALGILPEGVHFESIDGENATIIILLVIPRSKKLTHIRTLAEVARLLSREGLRRKILAAETPQGVVEAIQAEEAQAADSA